MSQASDDGIMAACAAVCATLGLEAIMRIAPDIAELESKGLGMLDADEWKRLQWLRSQRRTLRAALDALETALTPEPLGFGFKGEEDFR